MMAGLLRVAPTIAVRSRAVAMLGGGADYTAAATNLFANVRLPASIVAGVLLPLTFGYVLPLEGAIFDVRTQTTLVKYYRVLAVFSYASLLLCVVSSSVAINSLAENPHQPAASVTEFMRQECELAWISANVNFMFGLCGALTLVALRALMTWEAEEGRVAAGYCAAAVLLTLSVVDEQVKAGGYAENLPQLALIYMQLGIGHAVESRSPLLLAGLLAAAGSTVGSGLLLNGSDRPLPEEPPRMAGARGDVSTTTVTNAVVAEAEAMAADMLVGAEAEELAAMEVIDGALADAGTAGEAAGDGGAGGGGGGA